MSLNFSQVFTFFFCSHFVLMSFDEQNFKFELVDIISLSEVALFCYKKSILTPGS